MNEKKKRESSFSRFFEEKGFYIILFLCVAAIGIAGYVLFFASEKADEADGADAAMPSAISDMAQSGAVKPGVSALPAMLGDDNDDGERVKDEYMPSSAPEDGEKVSDTAEPASADNGSQDEAAQAVSSAAAVETVKKKDEAPKKEPEKPKVEKKAADFFVKPVAGDVIRSFCVTELVYDRTMGDWRTHNGADFSAAAGETVGAVADGVVREVYTNDFYGTVVVIDHGGELESIYYGLAQEAIVKAGDSVKAGDTIGSVMPDGKFEALEPLHMHLEMKKSGKFVDPAEYIK